MNVTFTDTHCHIQSIELGNEDDRTYKLWNRASWSIHDVIERANTAGVTKLVCVGCDLGDSELALRVANNYSNCFASIGIHPHEAGRHKSLKTAREALQDMAVQKKVVSIGECGLDYFYNISLPEEQKDLLKMQLEVAVEYDLPVIFHVREAFYDFWPIFDYYGKGKIRGVLHSFTDSKQILSLALERGLFIGINGISTFARDERMQSMYRSVPLDRILLETDSPYLTPNPYRGMINEPKQIITIAKHLVDLSVGDINALSAATEHNARTLFAI